MKIGVLVNNFAGFPDTGRSTRACVDLARHAERLGFDSVWVTDHVVLPRTIHANYPHGASGFPYTWEQDIHEPLVLMGALAEATRRVTIGSAVLVIPYRHPLLTAKMLATADQLAEGRIVLGAGVGWMRDEFEALGLAPEVFERRGAVTVEYLRAMQEAWRAGETVRHAGTFAEYGEVAVRPRPARAGGIPVWVGGAGDRALRRSVAIGDGHLAISSTAEQLGRATARMRELAREAGRDPGSLCTALIDGIVLGAREPLPGVSFRGESDEIVAQLQRFADAGLQHLVAGISRIDAPGFDGAVAALEQVAAEVLPAAREL